MPALNTLAAAKLADGTAIGDAVHVVHLYIIEPHPQRPDPGPYSGNVSEAPAVSIIRQPRTYTDRVAAARLLPPLPGRQIVLVDDLTPGANNPVWCTYGTCPNCAFLIRRDGTIDTVQTWFEAVAMERAIRTLLAR